MYAFKDSIRWVEEEIFWVCMGSKQGPYYKQTKPNTKICRTNSSAENEQCSSSSNVTAVIKNEAK
jgi:hypothetical protein